MKATALGIAVLALAVSCTQQPSSTSPPAPKQATLRTDTAPIASRLPKLVPLRSVWWQSVEITRNSIPSPPVHPAYRLWGLAELEGAKAKELSQNYEWQKMPAGWTPDITALNADLRLSDWNRSAAFTKDFKPQELPGDLFFERSRGVVYFDIEVE